MSRERFCVIKSALRFDDPRRRDKEDSLAPIRCVFEEFNVKLRQFVVAGPNLTVDEQLVEFHGRVRFKQYIASKPGKFGIKVFWVCDAETSYCLNGLIYIGKNSVDEKYLEPSQSIPEAIVMQLCTPFLGKGRNVTTDNWFTSGPLIDRLLLQKTTLVGTVRINRRDVPPIAYSTQGRKRGDVRHFYSDGMLLCSYWDKGTKPVLLLDSFGRIGNSPEVGQKPQTVKFYNETKSGVDNLDHMVRMFSAKRKCRRWPYSLAMNLVDIAGVNGSIILSRIRNLTSTRERSHCHYEFLKAAGYQLVDKQIKRRLLTQGRGSILLAATLVGYGEDTKNPPTGITLLPKQKRCQLCERDADKKTKVCCFNCGRAMCNGHRAFMCLDCANRK
jgi:hypothetical protein